MTDEHRLLDNIETCLARGRDLRAWWDRASAEGTFDRKFELASTYNRPDSSYGFFDVAPVAGRDMPVMGNFQEMYYDRPKAPAAKAEAAAERMRDQMREFVLRYFMRVSDFRQPEVYVPPDREPPPALLRPLSLCQSDDPSRIGFGFSQLYYKLRDTGEIGRFSDDERFAIVDLRDIGTRYEWIVTKVRIFDFSFSFQPFGAGTPELSLPLTEDSYLVTSRDFVLDEERPHAGELGHYGLGYAFIKSSEPSLLAYGPGEFDAAIELIDFHVLDDGRVRVTMVFVANRPQKILNLSLDPLDWGFRAADVLSLGLASPLTAPLRKLTEALPLRHLGIDPVYGSISLLNLMTAGLASRELCISRQELEKTFLLKHFMQHYQTVAGSLRTWRQIPDWLDESALPSWVRTGTSS